MTRCRFAGLVTMACVIAGCAGSPAPCFSQSSLVADSRVLAVRVDPPESRLDLTGATPIVPSSISALVVTPTYDFVAFEYGRAVRVTDRTTEISICLFPSVDESNAQPGCPDGSTVLATLDRIPSEQAPFTFVPQADLLRKAIERDPLHGFAGVSLQLQLRIAIDASTTLTATKTLSYKLAESAESINHAIELTGMEQSTGGVHSNVARGLPVKLLVAKTTGLRPLIGPGAGAASAIETYEAFDNDGALTQLQEHITYAFYAGIALFFGTPHNGPTAIYTGAPGDVADEPAPGAPDPSDGIVSVEGVFPGGQAGSFWVIAMDGRGGVAWEEQPYTMTDSRPCGQIPSGGGAGCPAIFFGCN